MILDNKTKKYFKIICLVLFVVALTGCTANLDSSGKLIEKMMNVIYTADQQREKKVSWNRYRKKTNMR